LRARHNPLERRPEPWVYSAKRCEVETTSKSNKIRQTKNTAVKLHCLRSAQIKTGRTVKSKQIKTNPRTIKKPSKNHQAKKTEHFKRPTFWHLSWQEVKTWKKYGIATLRPENMKQPFQKIVNNPSKKSL
jgi:hypothetical protein